VIVKKKNCCTKIKRLLGEDLCVIKAESFLQKRIRAVLSRRSDKEVVPNAKKKEKKKKDMHAEKDLCRSKGV